MILPRPTAAEATLDGTSCLRTGVFGGSFNPIHVGHIALGRAILESGAVDELWFMVSPQNPLKPQSELKDERLRYRLAQKALHGEDSMEASSFEFALPRPSYTWNTLEALRQAHSDRQFSLVIGGDNWLNFSRWYRHDDILKAYPLIVYPREGYAVSPEPDDRITIVEAPLLPVSSTEIRARAATGQSVAGLVPECIREEVELAYGNGGYI